MQREYNISRNDILMNYSWDDVQQAINDLPIERVITVYKGEKADNQNRYLNALCDKDEKRAMNQLSESEKEYNKRRELALAKQGG